MRYTPQMVRQHRAKPKMRTLRQPRFMCGA